MAVPLRWFKARTMISAMSLIILSVTLSACPFSASLTGNWVFTINGFEANPVVVGVTLNSDGTASSFSVNGATLVGALTWSEGGNAFTMVQVRTAGSTNTFSGAVAGNSMSGIWVDNTTPNTSGSWSASRGSN